MRDERKNMPAVMKAIDELDVAEKVQTIDYLRSSLETSSAEYTPPEWHERELDRREKLYAYGKLPNLTLKILRSNRPCRKAKNPT